MPAHTTSTPFDTRANGIIDALRAKGELKVLQVIDSPMDAAVRLRQADGSFKDVLGLSRIHISEPTRPS